MNSWNRRMSNQGSCFGEATRKTVFSLTLAIFVLLLARGAHPEDHLLRFQKTIGVGAEVDWNGWMSYVAFSPDGTMVASNGPTSPQDRAGGLSLWSFSDGRLLKTLSLRPGWMADNWKYYASGPAVVEVETGTPVISLAQKDSGWVASEFNSDARYVAFTRSRETKGPTPKQIRIVRVADGTIVNEFGRRAVFSLAFHPDNTTLASGHWDNVTFWNLVTGERIALLRGFGRYVYGIAFSRDGRVLAAGTDFGGLQIWDVATRTRRHRIDLQGGDVSTPAFSPDGSMVAVGVYGTGTVFVVDVSSGSILDRARVSGLGCGSVAFSPDGRYLITPSTGGLVTWPYDRGGTVRVFEVRPRDAASK